MSQEKPDMLANGGDTCPSATRLADFSAGGELAGPYELTGVKGTLYFSVDDGVHGPALWSSDGTPGGTRLFRDFGVAPTSLTEARGLLFFIVGDTLWRTDGTAAGTFPLVTEPSSPPIGTGLSVLGEFRGRLFFRMYTPEYGVELWASDGTRAGTRLYLDVNPGTPSSLPDEIVETSSGNLVFEAYVDEAMETHAVLEVSPAKSVEELFRVGGGGDTSIFRLTAVEDRVFFLVDERDGTPFLYVSDGTPGAATPLYFWDEVDTPGHFTAYAGRLYFTAVESDFPGAGVELWVSDGTPGGTGRLVDIRPGEEGSYPTGLTVFEGLLYFAADDGVHGRELWVSDGTAAGTRLARDIRPGAEGSSPDGLMVASRKLYFVADDGEHGREPWKVFHGRVRLVEDIFRTEAGAVDVFARAGSYLFFSTESHELWSMLTGAYCPPSGTR
ncbi:ELWxxDGT repeat protein [Myxococcus xanthus]|uniref:Hyalin repeat protein n=1 Tax=Myxococcus xanthus TaxID=34 RepID=A0A7Y4IK91_MYXXA|nr:ELWxxDGT repeat protein [Myxococcus xanthus]NOJ80661.1 hypothetical protein [Myxococcus xanthus]NOJ85865.1 hypothetical protein [Myxococcus xanthus]